MNSKAFGDHLLGSTSVVTWFVFSYSITIHVEIDSYGIFTHKHSGFLIVKCSSVHTTYCYFVPDFRIRSRNTSCMELPLALNYVRKKQIDSHEVCIY